MGLVEMSIQQEMKPRAVTVSQDGLVCSDVWIIQQYAVLYGSYTAVYAVLYGSYSSMQCCMDHTAV